MLSDAIPVEIKKIESELLHGNFPSVEDAYQLLFDFQSKFNYVYATYLKNIKFDKKYPTLEEIPFLPVSFFKSYAVKSGNWQEAMVFKSSSTTGKGKSKHYVKSPLLYQQVSRKNFESRFGSLENYLFAALLPGYLERGDSSLIYMIYEFMKAGKSGETHFYLNQYDELRNFIHQNNQHPIVVFGVPFALLRCFELIGKQNWINVTFIETGGMKGQEKEMTKKDLHRFIHEAFNPEAVYSEYGMTELLSQAYTIGEDIFKAPPSMNILIKELNDPFSDAIYGKPGTLNIFDMANLNTCSFIETEDLAIQLADKNFEILGRIDNREIRGCNLLAL